MNERNARLYVFSAVAFLAVASLAAVGLAIGKLLPGLVGPVPEAGWRLLGVHGVFSALLLAVTSRLVVDQRPAWQSRVGGWLILLALGGSAALLAFGLGAVSASQTVLPLLVPLVIAGVFLAISPRGGGSAGALVSLAAGSLGTFVLLIGLESIEFTFGPALEILRAHIFVDGAVMAVAGALLLSGAPRARDSERPLFFALLASLLVGAVVSVVAPVQPALLWKIIAFVGGLPAAVVMLLIARRERSPWGIVGSIGIVLGLMTEVSALVLPGGHPLRGAMWASGSWGVWAAGLGLFLGGWFSRYLSNAFGVALLNVRQEWAICLLTITGAGLLHLAPVVAPAGWLLLAVAGWIVSVAILRATARSTKPEIAGAYAGLKGVTFGLTKIGSILLGLYLIKRWLDPVVGNSAYVEIPFISSRTIMWVFAQLHLLFGAFVLGVPLFAVVIEFVGMKSKDPRYDKLAHEFAKLLSLSFTITAALGSAFFLCLVVFYSKFLSYMTGVFSPTILMYVALIFGEVVLAYLYYYTWEVLSGSPGAKRAHLALGILLNVVGTGLMCVANIWGTFMMTPGGISETGVLQSLWEAINNHTWMALNIHRFVANIAFGGFVVGGYAAFRFLAAKTDEDRAHYDWMGYIGNFIGVIGLIPMPFAGYYISVEIYEFNQQMGITMMGGAFSWLFIIQAVLIGVLFIGVNYYFWLAMDRIQGAERFKKFQIYMVGILIACFAIWMTPHSLVGSLAEARAMGGTHHPLLGVFGVMSAKNTVVNLIILTTFVSFLMYRRSGMRETIHWSAGGRAVVSVILAVALVALALVSLDVLLLAFGQQAVSLLRAAGVPAVQVDVNLRRLMLSQLGVTVAGVWILWRQARAVSLPASTRWAKVAQSATVLAAANIVIALGVLGYYVPSAVRVGFSVPQVLSVLFTLVAVTAVDVFLFLRAQKMGEVQWGRIPARSQYVLITLAVTTVLLMGLMGYLRSALRQNWHVYAVIRDTSAGAYTPTLGYATQVVGVTTVIFFALLCFVFWMGFREKRHT